MRNLKNPKEINDERVKLRQNLYELFQISIENKQVYLISLFISAAGLANG
jgi:hypothetical protein